MNRQRAQQAQHNAAPQQRNALLRHTAVQPVADQELSFNEATTGLEHDFSQLPASPAVSQLDQPASNASCSVSPQRCPFGGSCHSCPPHIQAKLKIGQPGDKYEQEADRVAEQVMRMPESQLQRKEGCSSCEGKEDEEDKLIQAKPLLGQITPLPSSVQRKTEQEAEKDEDEDKILQAKSTGRTWNAHAHADHPLIRNALSSPGQPLDAATRSFMEPRFGQDFSGVRVHEDSNAHRANTALKSRAFTHGNHILLGRGESQNDLSLMAHEATHVLQQDGVVRRKTGNEKKKSVGGSDDQAATPSAATPSTVSPAQATGSSETEGLSSSGAGAAPAQAPGQEESALSSSVEPATPAVASTGASAEAGGPELLMPEPPEGLSVSDRERLATAEGEATEAAAATETMPSADETVADSRAAVQEPESETTARAAGELTAALGKRAAPSPEIEELCARIRRLIHDKIPPNEESLVQFDPRAATQSAGNELNSSVEGEAQRIQGDYNQLQQEPQGTPQQEAQPLETPPEQVETPAIHADQAVPAPISTDHVSLNADVAAQNQRIDEAGMATEPANLIEDPDNPVVQARDAQGELGAVAERAPQEVLAEQSAVREQARGEMQGLQQQALQALQSSRRATTGDVARGMVNLGTTEEQMRTNSGREAQRIFSEAQTQVETLLNPLPRTAMQHWETGVQVLSTQVEQQSTEFNNWKRERYEGVSGTALQVVEYFTGLPDWAVEWLNRIERDFGDGVCNLLREISIEVNSVIATCEEIIDNANRQIADLFDRLPIGLQDWAAGQRAGFATQLEGLRNRAHTVRNDFNHQLTQQAGQAVQQVRESIYTLRQEAQGIIGQIADAIDRFIDDPARFIINGLLKLVGIQPAAFWGLVDRIGQVINDIADDPMNFANNLATALGQGFQQFFDNFKDHIIGGFFDWLFSGLGAVGVQIPSDFSLGSLITFFLQLMGITWPRIRQILARHIGEENVALIEKAYELIATLIERGPEGIFEMIKEQLNPQTILSAILDAAIDYLVEALIKAVTPRIIAMFNPAGAIVQAIEVVYRILAWIFNNAARIFSLVETVVNGAAELIAGNTGGMATAVEGALARLIAPVIDFLAGFLGLGDLPDAIADTIGGFQEMVLGVIERVVAWLAERGRALLRAIGVGGEGETGPGTYDGQIGKVVTWTAAGESHRMWIQLSGNEAVVKMSSIEKPVSQQLDEYEEMAQPLGDEQRNRIVGLVGQARQSLSQLDSNAEQLAHQVGNSESEQSGIREKDNQIESTQEQLKTLLKNIQDELGFTPSIEQAHNQAVASVSNPNLLIGRGPSIQGHRGRRFGNPNDPTRLAINTLGDQYGCHTTGATEPGTRSGNWIPDHQPPESILKGGGGPAVRFYPHSLSAANEQRYAVIRYKATMKQILHRSEEGWAEGVMSSWFWS